MGWSSGWQTRRELTRHLLEESNWTTADGGSAQRKTIKSCFRGNNVWAIQENFLNGVSQGKFIVLYMLQRWGGGDWAYKDVEETMGPTYYNCPLSYFDEVPDPGRHATEWREACRQVVAHSKSLQNGTKVTFDFDVRFGDGVVERKFVVEKYRRRTLFRRVSDNRLVTLTKMLQANAQVVQA